MTQTHGIDWHPESVERLVGESVNMWPEGIAYVSRFTMVQGPRAAVVLSRTVALHSIILDQLALVAR